MSFVASLASTSFPSSGQWYGQNKSKVQKSGDKKEGNSRSFSGSQYPAQTQGHGYNIVCKWEPFREQILLQWNRLTSREVDNIGPNRSQLAMLIQNKYGIGAHLVENYLRNFERTLPLI